MNRYNWMSLMAVIAANVTMPSGPLWRRMLSGLLFVTFVELSIKARNR